MRKNETHDRILGSASAIARREGLRAASVPRVMRGAGLTVGGFYAHFDSKTAMDTEIIRTMLGAFPPRWMSGLEDSAGIDWVARAVKRYLSPAHRDDLDGCPYPAVLSEIAMAPPAARQAFTDALSRRVAAFEANVPGIEGVSGRERALATIALTVGGLLLARATAGSEMSGDILDACRKWALPEADVKKPKR